MHKTNDNSIDSSNFEGTDTWATPMSDDSTNVQDLIPFNPDLILDLVDLPWDDNVPDPPLIEDVPKMANQRRFKTVKFTIEQAQLAQRVLAERINRLHTVGINETNAKEFVSLADTVKLFGPGSKTTENRSN